MCGIVGRITRQAVESLDLAMSTMAHRGPDAAAEVAIDVAGWTIQLGHRRLSILDLSAAANQPFWNASRSHVMVFNGEIYNHAALRRELALKGSGFSTRSDTEVLLTGYERLGASVLPRLNGMFAFAMLDVQAQQLVLARDPFGIKPLYLTRTIDGGLVFASEIRALAVAAGRRLEADPSCLSEFLLNGFLYEPRAGFVGVEKVPPGCSMVVDLRTMRIETHRYHDPLSTPTPTENIDRLIEAELQLEVEADVPVGVFFSGGIDSSVLAAGAPRSVEAFFVDYGDPTGGDARHAAAVASELGISMRSAMHSERDATPQSVLDEFRAVATGTEEPISDYTYIATRIISRFAREAGFKVMLSGMGGDELFAGYPRQLAARHWRLLHVLRAPLAGAAGVLRRSPSWSKRVDRLMSFANASNYAQAYTSLVGYFSVDEVSQLLGRRTDIDRFFGQLDDLLLPVRDQSLLRQAMHLDRYGFLAHNLTVTDRASMAESIEVRVPLLSTAIEARARQMTDHELARRGNGKLPLKRYLYERLSRPLVDRPKVGFNPPLGGRVRMLGRSLCLELLIAGPAGRWMDHQLLRRWVDDHFAGRMDHTYRIWQLIYLNLWLESIERSTLPCAASALATPGLT